MTPLPNNIAAARLTTWWCRVHPGQRVSWKGRDCPQCRDAHNVRQAIARREARERAAALEAAS